MTETIHSHVPPRITSALGILRRLNKLGVYLLPVRHHSPACAYATLQALQTVRPTHVLIEAPANCEVLLPDLQHRDSKPPLAMLCQTHVTRDSGDNRETILRSAYVPFCDYSPEWVALRFQQDESNPPSVECIDVPWSAHVAHENRVADDNTEDDDIGGEAKSLQHEHYFAHNHYVEALAKRLHCRDHDDVWEHLFELDSNQSLANWKGFFERVLVWCAMARLGCDDSELDADGSHIREQFMLSRIVKRYADKQGDMLIVTGGFHTLALIDGLGAHLLDATPAPAEPKTAKYADDAWLIRYSFDRLDALNGYASGMPSPAFYQSCWEHRCAQDTAQGTKKDKVSTPIQAQMELFSHFSHTLRQKNILQSNFTHIKTACEQAMGLAQLRGHQRIGRYDVIDACQTAFIKDSNDTGYEGFYALLHTQLSGTQLGQVVHSTRTPPLVEQVLTLLKKHRFNLEDTAGKSTKLDVLRKNSHRTRSQLLHLLDFLQVGFATRQKGPDFLHGRQLHLLFEEWSYAWSPSVEAQLIQLAEQANDIYELAVKRLLEHQRILNEQGEGQSSARAIHMLIQASMMGLTSQVTPLCDAVKAKLPHDPQLDSVIACGQQLTYLWLGRAFLSVFSTPQTLLALLSSVPSTAFFLLSQAQSPGGEQINPVLDNVLNLRNLLKQIQPIFTKHANPNASLDANVPDVLAQFHDELYRLLPHWRGIDQLIGAVHTLQFVDGRCDDIALGQYLHQHFGAGADPEQAVDYLSGMMKAVPTIFLNYPLVTRQLDALIALWDEETFITVLPTIRLAFTRLKPIQTHQLAKQVASLHAVSATELQIDSDVSEAEMLQGIQLNQQVRAKLESQPESQGILAWLSETGENHAETG